LSPASPKAIPRPPHPPSRKAIRSRSQPDDLRQKFGGIEGLPTTLLYDRQGILRKKVIGFEYTDTIDAEVKPLL
jgi:hypothetical protein